MLAMWLQAPAVQAVQASRLIAIATVLIPVVYIILQLLKKALPSISGVWAVIVNFLITAIAYVIALPHEQWFTMNTLLALATTVAGAAGVHGTINALGAQQQDKPPTPNGVK